MKQEMEKRERRLETLLQNTIELDNGTDINISLTKQNYMIVKDFLLAKKLEGCSINTIYSYHDCILKFIVSMDKPISDIITPDIRTYLSVYSDTHTISNRSLDNIRRILSSFFEWLVEEDIVLKNPVKKIRNIKIDHTVKKPFSDEEIELLRDGCNDIRELAIIELLYSSGIRVGELCGLNISDVNFIEREAIVFGKGSKERIVYFDARTKIHIMKYLDSRYDDGYPLFVSSRYPHNRLLTSGVETILKDLGIRTNIKQVHPHRFRRTFATNLLDRGVPIEQVQKLLGHTKIDTTMLYAMVNQSNVKINHNKFI